LDSEALKVVLLGPPGAGKGTQAARIAEYLEVPSVASGDLFRDHQKRDTELGRLARSYMQRGVLVPDEVTIRMVTEWIETEAGDGGFLLDGFPRTLGQAEALDGALSSTSGLDRVLYIRVSDEELVRRLTGRLVCRGCGATFHKVSNPPPADGACGECGGELYEREDDRPEAVGKRLEVYFSETAPLIDYYRKAGILREVDGEQSIDEVGLELMEKLGGGS
jgi:adenylate kinase